MAHPVSIRRIVDPLAAALAITIIAACGTSQVPTPGSSDTPMTSQAASSAHNQVDVTFVQGMIPHHQHAVTMSELATSRAGSPQLGTATGAAFDRHFLEMS